ncbi:MAG: WD40 repeat domain-containing protein, partial [Candidatus Poribacteria bacterium]
EAAQLASGLGRDDDLAAALMPRVLHWTGGHPYLTQRLGQAVAEDDSVADAGGVDRACADLFFSEQAQEQDSNLQFVRNQMLGRGDVDSAALLTLYRDVRAGKSVPHDETNPLVNVLQLSGIAGVVDGHMRVRNRIYEHVFHAGWVAENMPDAELRRQRAATRRGVVKASAVAAVVVALFAAVATVAVVRGQRLEEESIQHRAALSRAQAERGVRQMQEGNRLGLVHLLRARETVDGIPSEETQRELLWSGWYGAAAGQLRVLVSNGPFVSDIVFSPDGSKLFTAGTDNKARIWDAYTGVPLSPPLDFDSYSSEVAYSPTGDFVAAGGRNVQLWDARTGRPHGSLLRHGGAVRDNAFSADGKLFATASEDGGARIWDVQTTMQRGPTVTHGGYVRSVAFSSDNALLVTAASDGTARVVRTEDLAEVAVLRHGSVVRDAMFSPDNTLIATRSGSTVKLWDSTSGRLHVPELTHTSSVSDIDFDPTGSLLATGAGSGQVILWDVATGAAIGDALHHDSAAYHGDYSAPGHG